MCFHHATTSSEEVEVKISPCTPSLRVGRHLAFRQHPRSAAKKKRCERDNKIVLRSIVNL